MRRSLGVLAVVVLGALASVTAAQAGNTTITNTSTPFSFSEFVPCAAGGAGELVDFTGTLHTVLRMTINGNHFSETFHQNLEGAKGTGETTGDTYVGAGAANESFTGSLTSGQFTDSDVSHLNFNGQGSAPNLTLTAHFHLTVNANGDVTATFDDFSVDCG